MFPKATDTEPFNIEDNVGAMPSHQDYIARYERAKLKPNSGLGIQVIVDKIQKNKAEYVKVEEKTGVPWQLVAALHSLESSLSFSTWLANGDPLSGPTKNVPAGLRLPGNQPWKWFEAAVLSLEHEGFDGLKFNDIGDLLIAAESYNGLGYLTGAGRKTTPSETSPYLWSGTSEYQKGKYVSDGRFDPEAVSQQAGVVGIFKELDARGEMQIKGKNSAPVAKKATWFEIFRTADSNSIVGYEGSDPVVKINTNEVKALVDVMQKNPGANTFRVAPAGKEVPDLGSDTKPVPGPTPDLTGESFLLITKAQAQPGPDGLVPLKYEFYDKSGILRGTIRGASGIPSAQIFKIGSSSMSGSFEPMPEGRWSIGPLEFAGGKDNYEVFWASNLGPLWAGMTPDFDTRRAAIGLHLEAGAIGTAGCAGIIGMSELRKFVQLMRAHDPAKAYVNWGLGTCPPTPKINVS